MTSFQGYAKASSVSENTIKLHDPSEKILAESRRYLQQWRSRSQAEQNSRNQYLDALRSKFNKEQEIRQSNRALEKEFAEGWKDAVKQNWEVKIRDAENAARNARPDVLTQLAEFIPSVAGNLKQIDDKRRADGNSIGQALAFEYGISTQDVDAIQTIQGSLKDYDGKNINIINRLRKDGASWDQIDQIRRLSGYRRQGVVIADLIRGGQNVQAWANSKLTDEYELPGDMGKTSMEAAIKTGNKELISAVNFELRKEYLAKFKHLNGDLVFKYLRDPILAQEARFRAFGVETDKRNRKAEYKEQEKSLLFNELHEHGPQGYLDWVAHNAGEDPSLFAGVAANMHGYMVELAEEGKVTDIHINQLAEHMVVPHGEKNAVRYDKRWGKKIDELRAARAKYLRKQAEIHNSDTALKEAENNRIANQVEDLIINERENLKAADYKKYHQIAISKGKIKAANRILSYWNNRPSVMNDTFNIPHLQKLETMNMLTRKDVIRQGLTPANEAVWLKKAQDQFKPTDEVDQSFKREAKRSIENILARYGTESKKVQSSSLAYDHAVDSMRRYYKKAMIETNGNINSSKIRAIAEFNQLLTTDQYKISQRRTVDGRQIQDPHFEFFQVSPAKFSYPLSQYTTEKIRQNPDIFREEVMVDPNSIIEWGRNVKAGINTGYPPAVLHLANKSIGLNPDGTPKVTAAEIAKHQLVLALGKEEADKLVPDELIGLSREANKRVEKQLIKLLSLGPAGIRTAIHYSDGLNVKSAKPTNTEGYTVTSKYRDPKNLAPYLLPKEAE